MDEYIDREFVEQHLSHIPEYDFRRSVVEQGIKDRTEDGRRGFRLDQLIDDLPEDDASDVMAAYFLGYCRILPGPYRVWLLYNKHSGVGRSYLKGSYDPNPTPLASFLYLGIVEVPEKLWDYLYQNGPRSLRYLNGFSRSGYKLEN